MDFVGAGREDGEIQIWCVPARANWSSRKTMRDWRRFSCHRSADWGDPYSLRSNANSSLMTYLGCTYRHQGQRKLLLFYILLIPTIVQDQVWSMEIQENVIPVQGIRFQVYDNDVGTMLTRLSRNKKHTRRKRR